LNAQSIRQIIIDFLSKKPIFQDIEDDQDFFDIGASSLTIVDLQIQIEKSLKRAVSTTDLMLNPTLNGWVSVYLDAK
jgi:acyl carrier protein